MNTIPAFVAVQFTLTLLDAFSPVAVTIEPWSPAFAFTVRLPAVDTLANVTLTGS